MLLRCKYTTHYNVDGTTAQSHFYLQIFFDTYSFRRTNRGVPRRRHGARRSHVPEKIDGHEYRWLDYVELRGKRLSRTGVHDFGQEKAVERETYCGAPGRRRSADSNKCATAAQPSNEDGCTCGSIADGGRDGRIAAVDRSTTDDYRSTADDYGTTCISTTTYGIRGTTSYTITDDDNRRTDWKWVYLDFRRWQDEGMTFKLNCGIGCLS